jgi:hypothetical protein
MPEQISYPFDPQGTAESNIKVDEQHIIAPSDPIGDYYFIVPFSGPFFEKDLELEHYPSGQRLIHGVDYHLGWKFVSASRATAKPVYGSICILNRTLQGVIKIAKIRYLGGAWQINEARALELLLSNARNPRTTSWEQVEALPYAFPVIDHEWDLDDMVGASELNASLIRIAESIEGGGSGGGEGSSHVNNLNNPHQTTKVHVLLGNVENYSVAALGDLTGVTPANNKYMTPFLTKVMIDNNGTLITQRLTAVEDHVASTGNVHNMTAAQINLGLVANRAIATLGDYTTGVGNGYVDVGLLRTVVRNPYSEPREPNDVRSFIKRYALAAQPNATITHNQATREFSMVMLDAEYGYQIFPAMEIINDNSFKIESSEARAAVLFVTFYKSF